MTAHGTNTNGSAPDFAVLLFVQIPSGTTLNPPAVVGVPYSTTLTAAGGKAPLTWSLAPGSTLPDGLTLSAAGVISGSPTAGGSFSFTVQVVDSTAVTPQKATQTFSLTINDRATYDHDRLRGESDRLRPDDLRHGHGHRHAGQRDAVEPDRDRRPHGLGTLGVELRARARRGGCREPARSR